MRKIKRINNGSALVLVVIVTVLLSVVGVMFVMTSRIREMTTSNFADDRDLDTAVQAVTGKIQTVLRQDLFGTDLASGILSNGPSDSSSTDPWLASLEPSQDITPVPAVNTDADPTNDWYQWGHTTKLYGTTSKWDKILRNGRKTDNSGTRWDITKKEFGGIVEDYQDFGQCPTKVVNGQTVPDVEGFPADADGDGVADSLWERVPDISTSRGRPVFAAVRIIDNCAMLNLNNAFCFYQDPALIQSPFTKPWYVNSTAFGGSVIYGNDDPVTVAIERDYTNGGRYLSEVNYYSFLRGSDLSINPRGWYKILAAKRVAKIDGNGEFTVPYPLPSNIHNNVLMKIENPGAAYSLFDIGDEMEIRNRSLLTSKTESRFERHDVANFSLDAGGAVYGALEIPRDSTVDSDGIPNFTKWKWRIDPKNFDAWSGAFNGMWNGNPLDNRYKYDRRHLCTFYSFDRNIRTGSYLLLDPGLITVPAVQRQTVEEIFRPLRNQPIDLRTITDTTKLDPVTNNPVCVTANTLEARKNILHLLYAFRDYFYKDIMSGGAFPIPPPPQAMAMAAKQSAQIVANMIDYQDDATADGAIASTQNPFYDATYKSQRRQHPTLLTENPIFIDRSIIRQLILEVSTAAGIPPIDIGQIAENPLDPFEFGLGLNDAVNPPFETVYGYEQQPFISELYCNYDPVGGAQGFALELLNPYSNAIDLNGWNIQIGATSYPLSPANTFVVPAGTAAAPGRLVIYAGTILPGVPAGSVLLANFGLGVVLGPRNTLELQRPKPDVLNPVAPTDFLTVDETDETNIKPVTQSQFLLSGAAAVENVSSRDDKDWKFSNKMAYVNNNIQTLGAANNVNAAEKGCQLPVDNANRTIDRLADFQKIAFIGSDTTNTITDLVAKAFNVPGGKEEKSLRFDPTHLPSLSEYICTLSREEKGIPGRININTAPLHVIAAAIPPQLVNAYNGDVNDALAIAGQIVSKRSYKDLGELLTKIPSMKKYDIDPGVVQGVGDPGIRHDFEERYWIFNRLSNIFTVRSDTFTAYILVRLGTDGPQRRMIAVFDRSNCWTATDKPKLVALHPVPDPQ